MIQNTSNVFNLNYLFNKVQFWVVDCRKSHVQKCCNAMGAQNYTQGITRVRDSISIRVFLQLRPILGHFSQKMSKNDDHVCWTFGMISLTPLYISSVHIFYLVHVVNIIIFQGRTCFMFIKTVVVTRFSISTTV